jgi:fluoride exporter
MGGFTTYSSFNYETTRLVQTGALWSAALYVGLTLVGCLASGVAGIAAARALGNGS